MKVQMGRNFAVGQGQYDLDQARNAGGGLQMADIGFDRADDQRRCGRGLVKHGA
ncbi:hypothetical protein RZS08_05750 [Arthrospira platensis SPKY1]|nr:hypothetical protein [Arthrospira platensis SPKY1]